MVYVHFLLFTKNSCNKRVAPVQKTALTNEGYDKSPLITTVSSSNPKRFYFSW